MVKEMQMSRINHFVETYGVFVETLPKTLKNELIYSSSLDNSNLTTLNLKICINIKSTHIK